MSTSELFMGGVSRQEAAAESAAAEVHANLVSYIRGDRANFMANFSVGLSPDGLDSAVHTKFLESLGVIKGGEGCIVLPGGHRLYVNEIAYPDINNGKPCHITYSSDPVLGL